MLDVAHDVQEEEYLITLLVQGNDAAPRYRDGDRLMCAPKGTLELVGDVVVVIRDGNFRIGRLAALDDGAITIELGKAEMAIPRSEVGALGPVRLMAPGRTPGGLSSAAD